jgi:hypothetical protein
MRRPLKQTLLLVMGMILGTVQSVLWIEGKVTLASSLEVMMSLCCNKQRFSIYQPKPPQTRKARR